MKYFLVVTYDIKSDKKRLKIHQTLKNYGFRVQYSVFECELSKKQYSELRKKISKFINENEDSIRYYIMDMENKARTIIDGYGKILDIQDVLIL
jgi:CRISPR-associated protein Cas2